MQYEAAIRDSVTHVLYIDVDMRPLVSAKEIFASRLVAVQHPGFWNTSDPLALPFEKSRDSRARIAENARGLYVAGGIQGGPVDPYFEAVGDMRAAIESDFRKGVTAVWHDESHWNRYVAENASRFVILGPEYCWPESWEAGASIAELKVLALDKDHHAMRGTRPSPRERLSALGREVSIKSKGLRKRREHV
jgi:histo-blood group ABO system transferase